MTELGDFTNDLQRQVNQQKDGLSRAEALVKKALDVAGEAKLISETRPEVPEIKIDDLLSDQKKPSEFAGEPEPLAAERALQPPTEPEPRPADEVQTLKQPDPSSPRHSPGRRSASKHSPRAKVSSRIDTDELLDTFLDATRSEVEKARRLILDEAATNLRNFQTQITGALSKTTASSDLMFKKCQTKIQEQKNTLDSEVKAMKTDQANQVKQLYVASAELTSKLRALEARVDALTTAPKDVPSVDNLVGADGSMDLAPILIQLQAQMTTTSDLAGRLRALEEREVVSPNAIIAIGETLDMHQKKMAGMEVTEVGMEMMLSELKEAVEELKN
jgi:hypothetical protein